MSLFSGSNFDRPRRGRNIGLFNSQNLPQNPLESFFPILDQNEQHISSFLGRRPTERSEETFVGLSQEVQRVRANQGSRLFASNSTVRTQNTTNIPIQNTANIFNNNTSRYGSHNSSVFGSQAPSQSIFTNSVRSTFDIYRSPGAGANPQQQSILPNRAHITGRNANFSTSRQGLASLNQSLDRPSVPTTITQQPRRGFPVRPQTTGFGFQPNLAPTVQNPNNSGFSQTITPEERRQIFNTSLFPSNSSSLPHTGFGFQSNPHPTVQNPNNRVFPQTITPEERRQIMNASFFPKNSPSLQTGSQFQQFPNPTNPTPQTVAQPSNPNGQLQTLQTPPISPKGTGAPSFFVNNNPAPLEEAPQQEESVEEEDEYEEEGEELNSFSEDLEQLMINHQLKVPEGLFNNGAFMQNLTEFLQGYHIRPSKKTHLYPVSEQEPEINIPNQIENKEGPICQEERPGVGKGREKFRVVEPKRALDGTSAGFKAENTNLKKRLFEPSAVQAKTNYFGPPNRDSGQ